MKHAFLTLLVAFSITSIANAQTGDILPPVEAEKLAEAEILPAVNIQQRTHPEKIIFSQIKLSNAQPNIDAFAKASPKVANAQPIDKAATIFTEYNRINNAFGLHNEKDTITVQTTLKTDEYSSLQDLLVFDELDHTTFFKFSMYGYNVGIVPEDIKKFSKIELSKQNAEKFFQNINGPDVVAEFILKPTYADKKEPFVMNEQSFWLMFARIAEFRLWSNNNPNAKLLWYYRSPWYKPTDENGIGNLYSQP